VSTHLGEILVGSSLLLSKMRKAREEDILEITELKRRSTGMALEVDELRENDREMKKILSEKAQEILRLHARNGDLRAEADDLARKLGSREEEVTQKRKKSAKFEEEMAKFEEEMAKLREELVRKDEYFLRTKDELTRDGVDATGFEDAMGQVSSSWGGSFPVWADEEDRGWVSGRC